MNETGVNIHPQVLWISESVVENVLYTVLFQVMLFLKAKGNADTTSTSFVVDA